MIKKAFPKSSKQNAVGISVLLLFAITFAWLLQNTLGPFQPLESFPDWKNAQWIKKGDIAGKGYFRKNFNVSTLPTRAYLIVSGTEELTVYVNDNTAGFISYSGARPNTIMDVTNLLKSGNNLLAVSVNSNVHGVAPALIARLVIMNAGGIQREIKSDQSWRVARKQGFQKDAKLDWVSTEYNDFQWSTAELALANSKLPVIPLKVPEHVYKTFPKGYWLWSGNTELTTLSNEFVVEGSKIHDAWLGISSEGKYTVLVNGVFVAAFQGTDRTMEVISISPYLQLGQNKILLQAENRTLQPRLLVSGSVLTDEGIFELNSTANWISLNNTDKSLGGMTKELALMTTELYNDVPSSSLSLIYKEVEQSGLLSSMKTVWVLAVSFVIAAVLFLGFILFSQIARLNSTRTIDECFSLYTRPLLLGLFVVLLSLLLQLDPQFSNSVTYQSYVIAIVPIIIVFFELLILLEIRSRGESLDGN